MIKEEKLPDGILEKLKRLPDIVSQESEVMALFIFGSAVEGELRPMSDIDLAILLNSEINRRELFDKELEVRALIAEFLETESFDLVNMNLAPARFAHNILAGGKLIYYRDKTQIVDFCEDNTRKYLDFKYYRDDYDKTFRALLTEKYNG